MTLPPTTRNDAVELRAKKGSTSLAVRLTPDAAVERRAELAAGGWDVTVSDQPGHADRPRVTPSRTPGEPRTRSRRRRRLVEETRRMELIRSVDEHVHRVWEHSEANRRALDRMRRSLLSR